VQNFADRFEDVIDAGLVIDLGMLPQEFDETNEETLKGRFAGRSKAADQTFDAVGQRRGRRATLAILTILFLFRQNLLLKYQC
jgi:hypothetical protein